MSLFKKRKTPHERALEWVKDNVIDGKGIIFNSKTPQSYPEVTGYFIPTLYNWGEPELAGTFAKWLVYIQLPDGSFPALDGTPYTFDTGQVMRGLCAAMKDVGGAEAALKRACDYVLSQVGPEGQLKTPSTKLWGNIANDLIHVYVIPPLKDAGNLLGKPEYLEASDRILGYYKKREDLLLFDRLSHFHAYAIEALCELGELDLADKGMTEVEKCQRQDGSVPAYPGVKWACATGIAQYAVIWYKLGKKKQADRAMKFLERIQNKSGGFFGSYGPGAGYFPVAEISWAVKFFLDACFLRLREG